MAAFVACEASTVVARRRARLRAGGPVRSAVGGRRCAPTALRCSVSWPVAELAARAALAGSDNCAESVYEARIRARPQALCSSAPPIRSRAHPPAALRQRCHSRAGDARARMTGMARDVDIGPPPVQPGPRAVPSSPAPHGPQRTLATSATGRKPLLLSDWRDVSLQDGARGSWRASRHGRRTHAASPTARGWRIRPRRASRSGRRARRSAPAPARLRRSRPAIVQRPSPESETRPA